MTPQRLQYERLKAAGCCTKCRAILPPSETRRVCSKCRKRNAEICRERYRTRKAQRCCQDCGSKLPDGFASVRCPACKERVALGREMWRAGRDIDDEQPGPPVPRCKCGLALPCNDCIPGIEVFAARRPGGSTFPAPGGISLSAAERRNLVKIGQSKFSPRSLQYTVRR